MLNNLFMHFYLQIIMIIFGLACSQEILIYPHALEYHYFKWSVRLSELPTLSELQMNNEKLTKFCGLPLHALMIHKPVLFSRYNLHFISTAPRCGKNERLETCPDWLCFPQNCSQVGYPIACPAFQGDTSNQTCPGSPGCVCIDNYARDDSGKCIPVDQCRKYLKSV